MATIPDAVVERIKAAVDLGLLVGEHVELRRKGKEWVGRCPFHDDSNPSFAVNPQKGRYNCLACQAKGDAITWAMKYHGMTFIEAVHYLNDRSVRLDLSEHGISDYKLRAPYEQARVKPDPEVDRTPRLVVEIQRRVYLAVCKFLPFDAFAREYLEGRGLDVAAADIYGFKSIAGDAEWVRLREFLQSTFTVADLIVAGFWVPADEDGPVRPSFPCHARGRALVIPYWGLNSEGGWVLEALRFRSLSVEGKGGRYYSLRKLDSVERQNRVPFNAAQALGKSKYWPLHTLHITEGEIDAMSILAADHMACVIGVPGSGGWSDTWKPLIRHAKKIVLWPDGDKAGETFVEGIMKSFGDLAKWAPRVEVRRVPEGADVNSLLLAGQLGAYLSTVQQKEAA